MPDDGVEQHYARPGLISTIRERLRAAGKDLDHLAPADLAAIDEFHIRGRQATEELAARLRPTATSRVLDIGSGLGGPSRHLAVTYGCHVVGIDLTEDYCAVATELAAWMGLSGRVEYRQADALDLPFPDASFGIAWTQHVAMNIADKPRLYGEMHRVLRPGGMLAIYDVVEGPGGEPSFPVPWASHAAQSHLVTPEELRRLLEAAGFAIQSWHDTSEAGRRSIEAQDRRLRASEAPPLVLSVLFGAEALPVSRNLQRNLSEGRVGLLEVTARADQR